MNALTNEKKTTVVAMLCEGNSIRSIERMTGVHRDTVMRLGVRVGTACRQIMDEKMRDLPCKNLEVDEIWGYIGSKQKNAVRSGNHGDVWTFICIDTDTKLIPSHLVGKRDLYHARAFMDDVAGRMKNRVQLSSDSLKAYTDATERAFGADVDYGQISKTYSFTNLNKDAASRYSPAEVVKTEKHVVMGAPDPKRICFSTWLVQKPHVANALPTPQPPDKCFQ
jgi:transposase-like protein